MTIIGRFRWTERAVFAVKSLDLFWDARRLDLMPHSGAKSGLFVGGFVRHTEQVVLSMFSNPSGGL